MNCGQDYLRFFTTLFTITRLSQGSYTWEIFKNSDQSGYYLNKVLKISNLKEGLKNDFFLPHLELGVRSMEAILIPGTYSTDPGNIL